MKKSITTTLITADIPTVNGRVYSRDLLQKLVDDVQVKLKDGMFLGELEHPETNNWGTTNLHNVSHKITEFYLTDRGDLIATAEFLNTPTGKFASENLHTLKLDVRGIGEVDDNGTVSNYLLHAIDIVTAK